MLKSYIGKYKINDKTRYIVLFKLNSTIYSYRFSESNEIIDEIITRKPYWGFDCVTFRTLKENNTYPIVEPISPSELTSLESKLQEECIKKSLSCHIRSSEYFVYSNILVEL